VIVGCNIEPGSWKEFSGSPTLLRFVRRLGLDAALGMDLFCLIGIALAFSAFVSRQCRNFFVFTAMWMIYLSVFHVSFGVFLVGYMNIIIYIYKANMLN